jgi:hypothetical protein
MEFRLFVDLAISAAPALAAAAAREREREGGGGDEKGTKQLELDVKLDSSEYGEGSSGMQRRGTLMSRDGPAPLPPSGSILDDPDLVWTEVRNR